MKYIVVLLLMILLSSFNICNDAKEFHIGIVGEEKVEQFEKKFPQIVNDRSVYVAYLQKYYKIDEEGFVNLLRRR